ncbi:MAG: RNA 2',3'-cyclic phosphodiesterase [bacterium]
MSRLFIALPIAEEIITYFNNIKKSVTVDRRIKWESNEKMHLTIKFLGDVDDKKIETINNTLNKITSKIFKFDLTLNKLGFFNKNNYPTILWVNFKESKEIMDMYLKIENEFENIGFEKELKKFMPHLTLLRIKPYYDINELMRFDEYEINNLQFKVDKLFLMKSDLLKSGSVYTKLFEYKLN